MTRRSISVIDTHVHFYDCFQLDRLLDSAWRNAEKIARGQFADNFSVGLCVANIRRQEWMPRIAGQPLANGRLRLWQIVPLEEDGCAAVAYGPSGKTVYLIFGQELVSREGLEVLVYNRDKRCGGRLPVRELIASAEGDSLCILPWGPGKWLGRRGSLVNALIDEFSPADFCLGDSSGRPACWSRIPQFRRAAEQGFVIAPGSDPLDLPCEETRVAGYAEYFAGTIDPVHPVDSMLAKLAGSARQPFGQLETIPRFLANQIRIRL